MLGTKLQWGHLGQIKSMSDLPADKVLIQYIKEAMKLNEEGVKAPRKEKVVSTKPLEIPGDFLNEIKTKNALGSFEKFSPSHKKEYVEWRIEAKTEAPS